MCVLFVAFQQVDGVPLIVAANRDEAHARPAKPLHRWEDCTHVVAGRDEVVGGTWIGVAAGGRWASVTNIRHPEWMHRTMPRSRGDLVAHFLCGSESPETYAARVYTEREEFGGFNLLLGDVDELWYVNRGDDEPAQLEPGLYGLSNGRLDDPWPKVARGGRAFKDWIRKDLDAEAGFALLRDSEPAPDEMLPDTGVGIELERRLSPLFIVGDEYGTRSSTLLVVRADGLGYIAERSYGPGGAEIGTVSRQLEAVRAA